ncbi:cilium assembly protein DZIP1 isoform X2 [Tiliqua scincoides]|uniref:cilium assembly protein DZIP1 isoform X2 n=1 Tax=Tiliqua scincoides TaxID=71010 RepID=UPI003462FF3B
MIATQQMMLQAGASHHQCQFCDKAFMNYSFLHSHLQRRHSEESRIDKKRAQTDKLQEEIDKLKEQLQLTKVQLEAEQRVHVVRLSKEYEEHTSREEEIRQLFHKWKEEEKEKLASELVKMKEMFMMEFKELTAKNTELENHLLEVQKSNKHLKSNLGTLKDSSEFSEEKPQNSVDHQNIMELLERQETKWTSKVQALHQEHENEKQQLMSQIESLKTSMTEDLNASNMFYKQKIEELEQRLQEQNDLVIAQKHQIQKLATKSVENIRSSDVTVKTSAQTVFQPKASLSSMSEMEKNESKVGKSKHHIIHTLKSNPSLTRELRAVLEQTLAEKLESLGIKSGVHGIPSDHLSRVLMSVESAREERKKQVPDIQSIREELERQVSFRVAERASCSRVFSSPHISPEARQWAAGGSLSTVLPKMSKSSSVAKRPVVQRTIIAENTSTLKTKNSVLGEGISRKSASITTPPFSSEEEVEDDDIMQSYISPELSQPKACKSSSSKGNLSRFSSHNDVNLPEEDEVEEMKVNLKPSKGAIFQRGADHVEKTQLNQRKENKPTKGTNVAPDFIPKNAPGVKFSGVIEEKEDDWDLSSLEEENPFLAKDEEVKTGAALEKNDASATSMVHAWGTPMGKLTKEDGLQEADKTSTFKSSLVSVTDWSGSSDI